MRRACLALAAAMFAVSPVVPARAAEGAGTYEAQARASVVFADIDVQPQVDPALVDSQSAGSTLGTTARAANVWPGFLPDAFFFLYGFQSVERAALGVAEARYPQGPTDSEATLSNLAFANAGDPDSVPARAGKAIAKTGDGTAQCVTTIADFALPVGTIAKATSSSSIRTDGRALAESEQSLSGIVIGPLRIESLRAHARADAATEKTTSGLQVVGATVNGTPVTIDEEGVSAATGAAEQAADTALAAYGIAARIVPNHSETTPQGGVRTESGGVFVSVAQHATDPTGTPRDVRFAVLLGSAIAYARAGEEAVALPPARSPRFTYVLGEFISRPPPVAVIDSGSPDAQFIRRTIVVTAEAGIPGSAKGAYLGILLLAFGVLLVRPLVRAAARP